MSKEPVHRSQNRHGDPIYGRTHVRLEIDRPMSASIAVDTSASNLAGFIEKAPLERYVPPQKPSLVGLSRAALSEALAAVGVPPAQRKMRVQQIWHWLYVRGATRFAEM